MTVLVLAGTSDARTVLEQLKTRDVIASLAGATRDPAPLPVETRIGGFGGVEGLQEYLTAQGITAVLDATHPFAANMSANAHAACRALNIPHCILRRPEWLPQAGDDWHFIDEIADLAALITPKSQVFLATGRQTLRDYACLVGCYLYARVIDLPHAEFPFENGEFVIGRPPFSLSDEIALFERLKIDWLVAKNAGGNRARSKLDAARALGIPVALIKRPATPEALVVDSAAQAKDWLERYL
ncbi:MAG: precorrin-6x reductase [Rhodobacteraceae bacterium]|nr:MAG: precorrin-6x reductase [Paracoccaceae bacterium]